MVFTKTEIKVLELLVSRILDSFTIRGVSRLIKKDLKIVHTSVKRLVQENFLIREKNGLRLKYKENIGDLAYVENIRREEFFKKHNVIKIHIMNFLKKCSTKYFTLLLFGSYAEGKETKKSDVDLLAVLPNPTEKFERELRATLSASTKNFHITVINEESFREMFNKRDEINVVNETFNNHVLLYGAEAYYSLLGGRDVR